MQQVKQKAIEQPTIQKQGELVAEHLFGKGTEFYAKEAEYQNNGNSAYWYVGTHETKPLQHDGKHVLIAEAVISAMYELLDHQGYIIKGKHDITYRKVF